MIISEISMLLKIYLGLLISLFPNKNIAGIIVYHDGFTPNNVDSEHSYHYMSQDPRTENTVEQLRQSLTTEEDDLCTGCSSHHALSEQEVRNLYLEKIKKAILNKLGLESPPNVSTDIGNYSSYVRDFYSNYHQMTRSPTYGDYDGNAYDDYSYQSDDS